MEKSRIKSSNLYAAGHDATGLEVQFHSKTCASNKGGGPMCNCAGGDVWHYAGVPAEEHAALRNSTHPGAHFHARIRTARTDQGLPKYPGRKVV